MASAIRVDRIDRRPIVPEGDDHPSIDTWLLDSLLDSSVESVSVIGQDGKVCSVTQHGTGQPTTASPLIVSGQSWLDRWPVAGAAALGEAIDVASSGRQARCDVHCEDDRGRGRWLEVCFTPGPRAWKDNRGTFVVAVVRDVTSSRIAIDGAKLRARELQHRYCNMLSMVQAIVRISADGAHDPTQFIAAFEARIDALARNHTLLTRDRQKAVEIGVLLRAELEPYFARDRVTLDRPSLLVGEQIASALSLAIHELTSNAVKYGALSRGSGRLSVSWHVDSAGQVQVDWRETGGGGLRQGAAGFGSVLLEDLLSDQLSVSRNWVQDGLDATITFAGSASDPLTPD